MTTLRSQFIAALEARGETLVKRTFKYDVYTATSFSARRGAEAPLLYVGRSGVLRIGRTIKNSVPVSGIRKVELLMRGAPQSSDNSGANNEVPGSRPTR